MDSGFPISPARDNLPSNARTGWSVWVFVVAFGLTILLLVLAAPVAQANQHQQFASAIYTTFSFVCHQIPERSFHIAGYKFAVCSRCTGLYSGFVLAALIYPLVRSLRRTETPSIVWLFLAAAPLAVDFSLGYLNVWANTHLSRFATGALLSSVAVFYMVPGLIELTSGITRRINRE